MVQTFCSTELMVNKSPGLSHHLNCSQVFFLKNKNTLYFQKFRLPPSSAFLVDITGLQKQPAGVLSKTMEGMPKNNGCACK